MAKDLTNSGIERQNILNNPYALAEIEKAAGIQGIVFEGKSVLIKEQVADFFEVTSRTIDNYLDKNGDGRLSRREIPSTHALSYEFHLVDRNHNGYITAKELANWK